MSVADVKRGRIGIIGSGFVGSAAAYAMVMSNVGREIVRVDLDRARAEAEANDIFHAVPCANAIEIHAGEFADLAQCSTEAPAPSRCGLGPGRWARLGADPMTPPGGPQ